MPVDRFIDPNYSFTNTAWIHAWKGPLWDAMILADARTSGARELITEDLSHGQLYDGVRAINPFTAIE
jgi:predicted nucleic acid-binding protein